MVGIRRTALRPAGRVPVALALVAIVLVLYFPALTCQFVFDDSIYVTSNPMVTGGLTLEGCRWALTTLYAGHWHPVTWFSHMMDATLFGLDPAGHHATSIALHAMNTVLVFLVLAAATRRRTRSAVVAGLFAVHPLHVESVAWVSDRKDLLAAFFWLLAMGAYLRWTRRRAAAGYLAVFLLFFLALESKSMSVTFPFALLIWDAWPLGRFRARDVSPRALVLEKTPFLAAGGAVAWLTGHAADAVSGGLTPSPWPIRTELANAAIQYWRYAVEAVFPHGLSILYPLEPHPAATTVAVSAAALAGVTALVVVLLQRAPYLAAGWWWFLLTLVPVIGLFPAGPMSPADRYMYLPLLGLLVMITWGVADLLARHRLALRLTAVAAIVIYAGVARGQLASWETPDTLFTRAREVNPGNPFVYRELSLLAARRGDTERAMALEREALAIDPRFADAHYHLGLLLADRGRFEEASREFREAVNIKPGSAMSWYYLAAVLEKIQRNEESASCLARARSLDPSLSKAPSPQTPEP